MHDALDYTRFSLPDFAPGEEQALADKERELADREAKVRQLLWGEWCKEWTEDDFLLLSQMALFELLGPGMDKRICQAYGLLNEVRHDKEKLDA